MATNVFYPRYAEINAITNALKPTVTFTADHNFTAGEIVSFRVGKLFVMYEINNKRAKVISITSNAIVIDLDTSTWGVFSISNLNDPGTSPPICVPSSSGVVPFQEVPYVNIEDAFDNQRI